MLLAFQAAAREQASTAAGASDVGQRLGEAILGSRTGRSRRRATRPSLPRVTASVVMRSAYYWHLGLGGVSRADFLDGLAQTVHRLLHGAVDGREHDGPGDGAVGHDRLPARPLRAPEPVDDDRAMRPRGVQTRRRLLDAGIATLPVLGYHETRVDDIVVAAGVSHGTFYRYFDSKDALFQVLAAEAATRMVDLLAVFPEAPPASVADAVARREPAGLAAELVRHLPGQRRDPQRLAGDRRPRPRHRRVLGGGRRRRLRPPRPHRGTDGASANPTVDAIVLLSVIERAPYTVLVLGYVDDGPAIDASAVLLRRGLFDGARA